MLYEVITQSVSLLGTLNPYPGQKYADIWGYSADGREYAIMGVTGGTSIIDVTNPAIPVEIIKIPGPNSFYEWRDMKVHSHYAYIVTEGSGTGAGIVITSYSIHYTKLYEIQSGSVWRFWIRCNRRRLMRM